LKILVNERSYDTQITQYFIIKMNPRAQKSLNYKQEKKARRRRARSDQNFQLIKNKLEETPTDVILENLSKINLKCTAELEKAGYLVFEGYAAQYWQRALDEDALVETHITEKLKEAVAYFKGIGYDITDESVKLPGSSDSLDPYCVLNRI
jgi:hypothetical protein